VEPLDLLLEQGYTLTYLRQHIHASNPKFDPSKKFELVLASIKNPGVNARFFGATVEECIDKAAAEIGIEFILVPKKR